MAKKLPSPGTDQGGRGFLGMPWLETAAAPLPRAPRAGHAPTWRRLMSREPGLAPSRALLAFRSVNGAAMRREAADLRGLVRIFMERLRRGAEGGAEGPGAASGTGHTQHKATDLPTILTLPHNQGRKVDGPLKARLGGEP